MNIFFKKPSHRIIMAAVDGMVITFLLLMGMYFFS